MTQKLPPMTSLPMFETVGRHLSVARAAEELNLTPGAISRQVRNLEEHLGCALFERGHRRIVFTAEGQAYWAAIHAAMADIRTATDEAMSSVSNRPLLIACPRVFLQTCLIPMLGTLYARHPDLRVRLQVDGPEAEGADGRVVVGQDASPAMRVDDLVAGDLILVCSPAYLQRSAPLSVPDDLSRHVLLRSAEFRRNWDRWLEANAPGILPTARFMDFEGSGFELPAAIEGLGISVVRTPLVRHDLAAGRLVTLFDDRRLVDSYRFVFQERKLRLSQFRQFREWLRQACREEFVTATQAPDSQQTRVATGVS